MTDYYDYVFITDEQYEIAHKNGITKRNVDNRVYQLGWSVEEAITRPVKKVSALYDKYDKWIKKAHANGIPRELFLSRVNRGWDLERASSEPGYTREKALEVIKELEAEIEKKDQALAFYADPQKYEEHNYWQIIRDKGKVARQALGNKYFEHEELGGLRVAK